MLRFLTAGESHGPALVVLLEGLPAGLPLTAAFIDEQLARRQRGAGRGARQKIERDAVTIVSGLRGGQTLGSPVALQIENRDGDNWREFMDPAEIHPGREVTLPRPGHADLPGALKYDRRDARDILERASARETAARVAAGAVARRLLEELGVELASCVLAVGEVAVENEPDFPTLRALDPDLPVPEPEAHQRIQEAIAQAKTAGDTLGGAILVAARGLPPGLGSHVQWDRRLDGRLAAHLMSIPTAKGVLFGSILADHRGPGSSAQDVIRHEPERGFFRDTNHAGGLEGGITNGEELRATVLLKPIPTLMRPLPTVDLVTKEPGLATVERSDVCAVVPAAVIAEAVMALGLAEAFLEKFGGDSLDEVKRNLAAYGARLRES